MFCGTGRPKTENGFVYVEIGFVHVEIERLFAVY